MKRCARVGFFGNFLKINRHIFRCGRLNPSDFRNIVSQLEPGGHFIKTNPNIRNTIDDSAAKMLLFFVGRDP